MIRFHSQKSCLNVADFLLGESVCRLSVFIFFSSLLVQQAGAYENPRQMPGRAAEYAAATPGKMLAAKFQKLVAAEKSLFGYWPLAGKLDAANGGPALQSGQEKPVFRSGPVGQDSAIDLSNGGYLSLLPTGALDSPALTVELVCKVKYPMSGTLFGIRDGVATRFSLHYTTESQKLRLWNGSAIIEFEADTSLKMGEWYHVALAISETESVLWINGKRCRSSAAGGMSATTKGLPFLVGTTDLAAGKAERGEIVASHLGIYQAVLGDEAIASRLKALGWAEKLKPEPRRSSADEIARIDERVEKIKKDYGVNVRYKYVHKEFIPEVWHSVGEGSQLPLDRVPPVLDEIEAFLKVVPEPISRKELENIFLFDQLKIGGGGMGAMAYGKSIYLCCIRPVIDIRYSIFHEFAHILQVAYPIEDAPWNALLPEGYKYGQNTNVDPFGFDDKLRGDGFIINYSTWNRHEDIAVLSDYLFVRKDQTLDLMEQYPAIRRKAAAILKYYKTISPDYDLGFYDPVLRGMDIPSVSKDVAKPQ